MLSRWWDGELKEESQSKQRVLSMDLMRYYTENEEMIVGVNTIYAIAERSLKKIQDFNGVWTRDLAIPGRCSTNWAMKPSLLKRTSYWYAHFQSLWSRICFMVKVACRKPGKRFQIAQSKLLYTDVDPSDKVSCFSVFRFWILGWLISLMHASWNLLSLAQQISTLKTGERTQSIGQVRDVHGTPCM